MSRILEPHMQQESNMDSYKNPVLQYSAWKSTTGSVSSYPITGLNYHCFPRIHIVPQEIHHAKRVREEVQLERETSESTDFCDLPRCGPFIRV